MEKARREADKEKYLAYNNQNADLSNYRKTMEAAKKETESRWIAEKVKDEDYRLKLRENNYKKVKIRQNIIESQTNRLSFFTRCFSLVV